MRRALAGGVVLAVLAAGCGSTKTVTVTQTVTQTVTTVKTVTTTITTHAGQTAGAVPCSDADLQGSFSAIDGSAGAGQNSYTLVLTTSSGDGCSVVGTPVATLLDRSGSALPTHVSAAQSGQGSAAPVVLQHGESAKADARFSPDVPGPGEQHSGPCEPTAHSLRVTLSGGGSLDVPIRPPTAVCEHGTLRFSAFSASP
ncbi:MAG: DUF4232 domain-containing protein [Gaiellaceae bacterium]